MSDGTEGVGLAQFLVNYKTMDTGRLHYLSTTKEKGKMRLTPKKKKRVGRKPVTKIPVISSENTHWT